jgi:DNA-binding transcriptional regulator YiaG
MSVANKKINPLEILDIKDGDLTINKIELAYRIKRKYLDEKFKGKQQEGSVYYDQLENAFQELIDYIDQDASPDNEDVVISASLLPIAKPSPVKTNYNKEDNIIYMKKNYENPKNIYKNQQSFSKSHSDTNLNNRVRAYNAENQENIKELEDIISTYEKISGKILKILREKMNVNIDEMSNKIKVSKNYLEAIEIDSFDKLPAEVYARGFFNSYLNYLGLDRKDLVEALMDLYRAQKRLIKKR